MTSANPPSSLDHRMHRLVWFAAAAFAIAMFCDSASRWAQFGYRTFDLAFYVQALWKLSHGDLGACSLLNVPLLGNHASVIVLLIVPLFAIVPHPLLPVALQILALATMAPVGFRIARRAGLEPEPAGLLAIATLLAPVCGFVALHEFHPEAFAAPFLLLAIDAFQRQSRWRFWLWFFATLACQENMTLLLATWCGVNAFSAWREGRRRGQAWFVNWCLLPGLVALGWAVLYACVLSPLWNGGNVDYTTLYGYLAVPWSSLPRAVASQLAQSLRDGDLLTGLLFPLLFLPLLRPRWLVVALPILLQHFLSIRPSEWQIEYQYAAPLAPLFWIAACEAVARISKNPPRLPAWSSVGWSKALAILILCACVASQFWLGPLPRFGEKGLATDGIAQEMLVASVPPSASVVAGLPYLSHLAERQELISLHHVLKGLKTLSRKAWLAPRATDVVVVDYADSATFDPGAGYYHPDMRETNGLIVPSSDRLLHAFLRQASWDVVAHDSVTVFRRRRSAGAGPVGQTPGELPGGGLPDASRKPAARLAYDVAMLQTGPGILGEERTDASTATKGTPEPPPAAVPIDSASAILSIGAMAQPFGLLCVESRWRFSGERKLVPWMALRLTPINPQRKTPAIWISRGLCVPEGWDNGTVWQDRWTVTLADSVSPGSYKIEAVFFDNAALRWKRLTNPGEALHAVATINLGIMRAR